jgi:hypothetical protein
MAQVTQNGEQHVLINVLPTGIFLEKDKFPKQRPYKNTKIQQRIARENTTTH